MPCYWTEIRDASGKVIGHAHVNARGRLSQRCSYCPGPGEKLCDGPLPAGVTRKRGETIEGSDTTCSRPLCARCAIHVAPDRDFCREAACRSAASAAAASLRDTRRQT